MNAAMFQMDDMLKTKDADTLHEQTKTIRKINKLKDIAMVRAASQSVQAQAVTYLKRKIGEHDKVSPQVIKAMSSGLPVVAARAGGVPDIIPPEQEGKTRYLFTPGDLDDCLNKLVPLLDNKGLRENIGQSARVEMEKYDWRAATRVIRNQQYNAAIWFWRRKRAQLLKPLHWLAKFFLPTETYRKITAAANP